MGEFQNEGPGSEVAERVNWSKQLSEKQASSFNADEFISASKWLPLTHIKFDEMP